MWPWPHMQGQDTDWGWWCWCGSVGRAVADARECKGCIEEGLGGEEREGEVCVVVGVADQLWGRGGPVLRLVEFQVN